MIRPSDYHHPTLSSQEQELSSATPGGLIVQASQGKTIFQSPGFTHTLFITDWEAG
jgi:hypothetical protein